MSMLSSDQQTRVSEAIRGVESATDAELVTVLADRADDYYYIPTLWAALAALLSPWILLLSPYWLETFEVLAVQLAVFVTLALVLRIPPLLMKLVPRRVRYWRASSLARRQFLEQNLHHTKGETGLLIFVSQAEHYVEILADRGISEHVSDGDWQEIVDEFTVHVRAGRTLEGFEGCIEKCGELLARFVPATEQKNELPNHLVMLGR